ncbi:MAG: tetratricopeptide repeat protein [Pontixanthobacter sp.]
MAFRKTYSIIGMALLLSTSCAAPAKTQQQQLVELAEKNHAGALYHLGMMYLTGTSVQLDRKRAVEYFRKSYAQGDPLAAYKLGCFYDGQYQLLPVDFDRALKLKLIAAQEGYALAQQDVARLYARQNDIEQAKMWLKRAADQGTADALVAYASIHNGFEGLEKDPSITAAYFRLYLKQFGGSSEQREWTEDFEATLTDVERSRSKLIIREYVAQPTALTLRAMRGQGDLERVLRGAL